MSLQNIADKIVETDVLVVGGGLAGCLAAAKMADKGLKTLIAEKANVERSGGTAHGIDHYPANLKQPMTPEEFMQDLDAAKALSYVVDEFSNRTKNFLIYSKQIWAVEEAEKYGVPMKWDTGDYYGPYRSNSGETLRVHWQNIKPILNKICKEKGVDIMNRTMVVDFLKDEKGAVIGATAINVRTAEFIVIKAKATVVATGCFGRLYETNAPDFWRYKYRYHYNPGSMSGDGWAAAYRAGAELANMEQNEGILMPNDEGTISAGNFGEGDGVMCKVVNSDGVEQPIICRPRPMQFTDIKNKGKDPIYQTLEHLDEDFHKRMEVAIVDEYMVSFKYGEEREFNPKTHHYEVMECKNGPMRGEPGIEVDHHFRTCVDGLYAIGDCIAGGRACVNSVTSGLLIGEAMPEYLDGVALGEPDEAQVQAQKENALAPLYVEDGTDPTELESAVRFACDKYVGIYRSTGRLQEGRRRLDSLKRKFLPKLMAETPHDLMKCHEVKNILELAELHMQANQTRKESRGKFISLDYPDKDPAMDGKLIYQRLENGQPVIELGELEPMDLEFLKGVK